jgi:hypothetical protein
LLAAALGLWMGQALPAQEPARPVNPAEPPSANQKTADTIAEHLRQSGQLRQYSIDVAFANGTAELNGVVADQLQREEALRVVQGVPGVERVRDHLRLAESPITPVQAAVPAPVPVAPPPALPSIALGGIGVPVEPAPLFAAAAPSPFDVNPPKLPPYAWPTYAPYNNLSRVAYPTAYPYNAWPFIGPIYPFPKIPPGWRSVKLEWQDGHWWYSKVACPHDWWRVRYW